MFMSETPTAPETTPAPEQPAVEPTAPVAEAPPVELTPEQRYELTMTDAFHQPIVQLFLLSFKEQDNFIRRARKWFEPIKKRLLHEQREARAQASKATTAAEHPHETTETPNAPQEEVKPAPEPTSPVGE